MAFRPNNNNPIQLEQIVIINHIDNRLAQAEKLSEQIGRPFVTLSYAQTLDGSIAFRSGPHLDISNRQSYTLTHQLRANHQAILVGIRTVLSDDPRLTVRLVEGDNPQPIVLDSQLRCPLSSKLVQNSQNPPWIMTSETADLKRQAGLEALGVRVFRLQTTDEGTINLDQVLTQLAQLGIHRLMVEGGGQVITSFLKAKLVDQVVLTIGAMFVGGLSAVGSLGIQHPADIGRLQNVHYHTFDSDLIIRGDLVWE